MDEPTVWKGYPPGRRMRVFSSHPSWSLKSWGFLICQKPLFWSGGSLKTSPDPHQCLARSLFWLSRPEREFLSFNIVSCFEKRTEISFCIFVRKGKLNKNENIFIPVSCFKTRTRYQFFSLSRSSKKNNIFTSIFENENSRQSLLPPLSSSLHLPAWIFLV